MNSGISGPEAGPWTTSCLSQNREDDFGMGGIVRPKSYRFSDSEIPWFYVSGLQQIELLQFIYHILGLVRKCRGRRRPGSHMFVVNRERNIFP